MIRSLALTLALFVAASAGPVRADTRLPADELMRRAEAALDADPAAAATLIVEARSLYARAHGDDSAEVALADYRLALARALGGDRKGQLVPMADAAERLAARAGGAEMTTRAGAALIVAASFTMTSGDAARTDRLRDRAMTLLQRSDLARGADLAEAWRVAADVLIYQNRPREALDWADRSVRLYRDVAPDSVGLVYALARRGSAHQRLSQYPQALADLRGAAGQADRVGGSDPVPQVFALRALGNQYWRVGEVDLAIPLMRRALDLARPLPAGFPYAGALARETALLLSDAGRTDEARTLAEETVARTAATLGGGSYEYASASLMLARLDLAAGDLAQAEARIAAAERVFATALVADNSRRFETVAARAALAAAKGDGATAAKLYDRAGAMLAHYPADDTDRIDLASAAAAARLSSEGATRAAWSDARAAADGLTTRIVRQAAGVGAIDASRARSDRVYATALDVAWGRRAR